MPLPKPRDSYLEYTNQLIYLLARLRANEELPDHLGTKVKALIDDLDEAFDHLRAAQREEFIARAKRDFLDEAITQSVRIFKKQLNVWESDQGWLMKQLFPQGLHGITKPQGIAQVNELKELLNNIDRVLNSDQLNHKKYKEDIRPILEKGKNDISRQWDDFKEAVQEHEEKIQGLQKARDKMNFIRKDGVQRMGMVIGELRMHLGGSQKEAYKYTLQARNKEPQLKSDLK